jgi:hypothetical protein
MSDAPTAKASERPVYRLLLRPEPKLLAIYERLRGAT